MYGVDGLDLCIGHIHCESFFHSTIKRMDKVKIKVKTDEIFPSISTALDYIEWKKTQKEDHIN